MCENEHIDVDNSLLLTEQSTTTPQYLNNKKLLKTLSEIELGGW